MIIKIEEDRVKKSLKTELVEATETSKVQLLVGSMNCQEGSK